jgi:apolipoprotein N-acyltransferase
VLGSACVFIFILLFFGMHLCDRGVPAHLAAYAGLSWFAAAFMTRPGWGRRCFLFGLLIAYGLLGFLWMAIVHEDQYIGNRAARVITSGRFEAKVLWHTYLTGIYGVREKER